MPTVRDRAFSELALRLGRIEEDKLRQAEETLRELERFGISKFLGAILVEKKAAEESTVAEVVQEIGGTSARCRSCEALVPLSACDTRGELKCPGCQSAVVFPEGRIPEEDLAPAPARPRSRAAAGPRGERPQARGARPIRHPSRTATRPEAQPGKERGSRASLHREQEKVFCGGYPAAPISPPEIKRHKVQKLLGTSASGRLYRIQDNGIFGALKVLDPAVCSDKARFKSWLDFMQRVQDVPRSATVKPTQFVKDGGVNYLVRPYVAPGNASLRGWLREANRATPRQILDLAVAILNALSSWHSLKIVHGNLKPENVILAEGAAQLTDPGLNLLLEGLSPEDRIVRAWDGARYAAPEVLQGGEATPASDVYSAGRIFEDLLDHRGLVSEGAKSDPEPLDRLRAIVPAMTAIDPAERHPSAKEVLRDIQKPLVPGASGRPEPGADARRAGPPSRHPAGRRGPLRLQVLGPAALFVVIAMIGFQGWSWARFRSAIASPSRAAEVSDEMLRREIADLGRESKSKDAQPAEIRRRWGELLEVCRHTPWETRVRKASADSMADPASPRKAVVLALVESAREKVAQRRWTDAARVILEAPPETEESGAWIEVRRAVWDGLYAEFGMLLVPRGKVTLRIGQDEETIGVEPFLVGARQVTYAEAAPKGRYAPKGTDPSSSVVNVGLADSAQLARLLEKRLPTFAEWVRFAEVLESEGAWGAYLRERVEDVGDRLEWVEAGTPDALARASYGFCLGATRPGVPISHPVRRWVGNGYPDVAVRLVRDIIAVSGE